MLIVAYAVAGLAVGRVLALLAACIPSDPPLPLFKDPAACERCGAARPWQTLLPVIGPLLAEPCPTCRLRLSRRRLAIELTTGVVFALVAWRFPASLAPVYAAYAAVLVLIAAIDIEHRLIFDIVLFPAIFVLGPVGGWLTGLSLLSMALGAAIWAGFMLLSKWLTRPLLGSNALGAGDIYLAVFLGTICGFKYVFTGMVAYALLSGAWSAFLLLTRLRGPHDAIPYAPLLILGAAVALWQQAA